MTSNDQLADDLCTAVTKTFNVPETVTINGIEKSVPLSKRNLTVGQFAALAGETPGPTVEDVDADYAEVEDNE